MSTATITKPLSVTLDDVLSWEPCYEEDRVRELWGDRERVTAREVLECEALPASDRLWLVLREELLPEELLHRFGCRVAADALDAVEARGLAVDPRSRAAIATKLRWLAGEASDAELSAARDAARDAAWSAARDAAWSAAWSAARDAARDAAWDAAWDAARSAQGRLLLAMLLEREIGGAR